ncbi:hypothetical protein WR25_08863 isoform A [Diploscapter pachys]|uniref:Tr-type G domain-containing protein n=1 Tax=Diploscapter pachys TaxID=2018661 RepID=A0A2A2JAZ0_9BILA|nr:hypothetical protein WR25_08863 isoform A [Diploscapter pachys]
MLPAGRNASANLLRILLTTPSTSKFIPISVVCAQQTRFYAKNRTRRKFVEEITIKNVKSEKPYIDIYSDMTAQELAKTMKVDMNDLADFLTDLNPKLLDSIVEERAIDQEFILKAVAGFGCKPRVAMRPASNRRSQADDDILPQPPAPEIELAKRPPVVTIMGHVDHGKTTLLDTLRKSNITAGEFGGITQHIGAFSVALKDGRKVTFLDTPGHAAFAAMRSRGAHGADLVILVVAADDGVKEQTEQSIEFARQANVPLVVAINKCDKPQADPTKAMRSLLQFNIVSESMGGDVQCIQISALQGTNIDALQEAILTQADIMNIRATPKGRVEASVIEATTVHGIGKVTTLVVARGTLRKGAVLVGGATWCKVRTMTDENGKEMKEAGPGTPVRISGWRDDLPNPGDLIIEAESTDKATKAVAYRVAKEMETKAKKDWGEIEEKRRVAREEYVANRKELYSKGIRFNSTIRRIVHKKNRLTKDLGDDTKPRMRILVFIPSSIIK